MNSQCEINKNEIDFELYMARLKNPNLLGSKRIEYEMKVRGILESCKASGCRMYGEHEKIFGNYRSLEKYEEEMKGKMTGC